MKKTTVEDPLLSQILSWSLKNVIKLFKLNFFKIAQNTVSAVIRLHIFSSENQGPQGRIDKSNIPMLKIL